MTKRNLDILSNFDILYIEDETHLLHQTTTVLEDFVRNLYPCQNLKKAYEVLENKNVDAIISDILLEEATGIELLKNLRKEDNFFSETKR